jgi:hypothetical protein
MQEKGEGKPFKLKGIIERIDLEDKDAAEFLKYFVSSEYTKFYTLAEFKRFKLIGKRLSKKTAGYPWVREKRTRK